MKGKALIRATILTAAVGAGLVLALARLSAAAPAAAPAFPVDAAVTRALVQAALRHGGPAVVGVGLRRQGARVGPGARASAEGRRAPGLHTHPAWAGGRERAALAATVICYRPRSALRDVGKALGLSTEQVERLAQSLSWWDGSRALPGRLEEAGFDPETPVRRRPVQRPAVGAGRNRLLFPFPKRGKAKGGSLLPK